MGKNTSNELETKVLLFKEGEKLGDIKAIRLNSEDSLIDALEEKDFLSLEEVAEIISDNPDFEERLEELEFEEQFEEVREFDDAGEDDEDGEDGEDDLFIDDSFLNKPEKQPDFILKFVVKDKYAKVLAHIHKFVENELASFENNQVADILVRSINIKTGQVNTNLFKELLYNQNDIISRRKLSLYKKFLKFTPAELIETGEYKGHSYTIGCEFNKIETMQQAIENNSKSVTIERLLETHIIIERCMIDVRGSKVYIMFKVPSYEIDHYVNYEYTIGAIEKFRRVHLAYKLGDLIGTLADEKQEMNLNMQAILSNDINVIWKNVNTLCTVEKLTDGDKWGIRIKDESTEKFLKNDIVIWANDCSESYSLDFEVILNKKHESIYKEMNPVVNVLKEQGLVTEVEDFIEKFNVLLHYFDPIGEYCRIEASFLNRMYRLDQAEQKIIFEHLEKHVETENTFIENIRYKVTDNYMHRNNEVEMAMTLIDVIYENISKLDAFSVEETIEGILFKFKADIVGDSRISLLEERLKNRQHIIKKYTLE